MRFLNELTTEQIQSLISAIGINWQDYKPNAEGWINFDDTDLIGYTANSTIGVNIYHGGFQDHYLMNTDEGTGDIIDLKAIIENAYDVVSDITDDDRAAVISWAKSVLGMPNEIQKPQVPDSFSYPNDFLRHEEENPYVRCPVDILGCNLSASEKIIWLAIYRRCGKKDYSFPGIRKLAQDTNLSVRTVQRSLDTLKATGLIFEQSRGDGKATAKFPVISDAETINQYRSQIDTPYRSQNDTPTVDKMTPHRSQNDHIIRNSNQNQGNQKKNESESGSDGAKSADVCSHHLPFFSEAQQIDPAYKPIFQQIRENRLSRLSADAQRRLRGAADQIFNGKSN